MNDTCCQPGVPAPRGAAPAPITTEEEALAELAKAIAHPARVRLLKLLIERNTCVCGDLVESLPLAQSTVSQHLKVLKDAGLVQGEIDGPRTCYCINRTVLKQLQVLVAGL